jgi:hypothetical protein
VTSRGSAPSRDPTVDLGRREAAAMTNLANNLIRTTERYPREPAPGTYVFER